jgi:exopolyphosphatase / guanosine-5'-triphosphate,3'-diphosphate pyrophosphatase
MPRYAAIDIGSNSVRMLAAETVAGQPMRVLAADREVTRLGASVFKTGRISEDAIDFVSGVLERFAAAYQKADVIGVRAVATSAVRDASNQAEFIDRAAKAAGTAIEIISGTEEARLIHLGVQTRWPQPGKRLLMVDVGGGSAEIIAGEDGRMVEGISRPLGAVRLAEVFLKHDPPSGRELQQLEKFIGEKLSVAIKRIGLRSFDRAITTSATAAAIVSAVNRVPRARRDEADRLRASMTQLRRLYRELASRDLAGRRKIPGIGPRRAEIIVPGVAVILRALEAFDMKAMYYSTAGVRDGIIADLAARGVGRQLTRLNREQIQVVEGMARKYGVAVKHGRTVAALAQSLFECLQPVHKLSPDYGKLLEAAAYLHDVGHFVSDTGHHKHSQYLVQNSDLPGFTDRERLLIALLCRYHRKTLPNGRHVPFQTLNADMKRAIAMLTPLLRIADALDSTEEHSVARIACEHRNGAVLVSLDGAGDADLELWAAERAADAFRQLYDRPIVFVGRRRSGQS